MDNFIILAKEFSVSMAIVDFIPVIMFGIACFILLKYFTKDMNKAQFALFSCGTIDVFIAGFLKATYKLLYAANICDFESLNKMFFPVQSIGFLLAGISMIWYVMKNKKTYLLQAPPIFSGTFLFVGFMCGGLLLLDTALCIIAKRMKKPWLIILFIVDKFNFDNIKEKRDSMSVIEVKDLSKVFKVKIKQKGFKEKIKHLIS